MATCSICKKPCDLNKEGVHYKTCIGCRERTKQYYIANKEKIKQKRRQSYKNNKEKIKQYRDNNKEKIKQYQKQYNNDNK